ncbi:hypothetical protein ACI2UC_22745 [Ralstonia nicotianae]|uniref:hypothetical protein n=1 Tax=Ralstonia pseudosolanacearum TaxID=1310165 RepID=UPI003C2455B9
MSDLRGWLAVWCADAFAGWFKDLLFSLGNLLVTNYFVFVCGHFQPSAGTFDWAFECLVRLANGLSHALRFRASLADDDLSMHGARHFAMIGQVIIDT